MTDSLFVTLTTAVLEHRDPVTNKVVAYSAALGWYVPGENFVIVRVVRPGVDEGWEFEEDAKAMCKVLWGHLFEEQPVYAIA